MATKKKVKADVARCNMGATGTCGARGNQGMTMDKVTCGKNPYPWQVLALIIVVVVAYILIR